MSVCEKSSALRPIEILLVDDDAADIKLTRRELERNRVLNRVHVARDGVEAMKFLRHEGEYARVPRPDLILLDLNMPRKNGRQVLEEIKRDDDLKQIPVIVLTTSDAPEDVVGSYQRHANSYITKPVEIEQFRKAILMLNDYWISVVKLPVENMESN